MDDSARPIGRRKGKGETVHPFEAATNVKLDSTDKPDTNLMPGGWFKAVSPDTVVCTGTATFCQCTLKRAGSCMGWKTQSERTAIGFVD